MKRYFEKNLDELHEKVVTMTALTESMLRRSALALKNRDAALAQDVIDGDDEIDGMESEIERRCIALIALQQPLASDLRQVLAVLKMITDIERIADQAADICEVVLPDVGGLIIAPPGMIYEMTDFAADMVHDAIHAYIHQDEELALAVIANDERMDDWFNACKEFLLAEMRDNPECAEQALKLYTVAKYLERVADHATNIAEWAIYRITGQHISQ